MNLSKQHQENMRFLSRSLPSKEEFMRQYRKLYNKKESAVELCHLVLAEIEKAVIEHDIDYFKKLCSLMKYICEIEDRTTFRDFHDNSNNPVKNTNLVILACKHNNVKILKYLFGEDSKILHNLSGDRIILPHDEDEECHNAFYYAIRSGNIDILDTLIDRWPGDYFAVNPKELDEILSRAFEDLKLQNVLLLEEIEIFVENKLIALRFFSDTSRNVQNAKSNFSNIQERVGLVLENIRLLKAEFLNAKEVNEKFLFIVRFIAQNIHNLKRQLKSTYDRLPWEEMEFYLVSFVSSHVKPQEINLFYCSTLNKRKVLQHLGNFAKRLEDEISLESTAIGKFAELPKLKREKVVAKIICSYPEFEELYKDYQQIRDIYSLQKISNCVKLALSANPKQREGELIIIRVLQVMGEYLKNTLESPNLSNTTSELLLLTLPKNTRKIIIDLRNSLSHANSLDKRTEIEENKSINFFTSIIDDIKRVGEVVTDILYSYRIKMIRVLSEKIVNSKNLDEVKEIYETLCNVDLDDISLENCNYSGINKVEELVKKLNDNMTDKTYYEKHLFDKINEIISSTVTKSENMKTDFILGLSHLKILSSLLIDNMIDRKIKENDIAIKLLYFSKKEASTFFQYNESHELKEIADLTMKIFHSAKSRRYENFDNVAKFFFKILYITKFEAGDIKWIDELRIKLNDECHFIPMYKEKKISTVTEKKYNKQLSLKLSELKSVLSNTKLSNESIKNISEYRSNTKKQAVVEMLVLDIMSILSGLKNCLENNLLFLDNITPVLTGKCLRNYIAHDNALVQILFSDPSTAVISNAEKLISHNIMKKNIKIGKFIKDNPFGLKDRYTQSLFILSNQERMFVASEEGNLEDFKSCLKKGADIRARNMNSWTTLHFAAKGSSLELVKFILDKNVDVNSKTVHGQSPFHIAAACGSKDIVSFFVEKTNLHIDDQDKKGKTPLHLAAQNGQKDVVEILINSKANVNVQDSVGYSPLHSAVINNHVEVVKILLHKEVHVDINEATGGYTSLHLAADKGHLELVNFFLSKGANVNTRNDREGTPLHIAALNGHLEVVSALVSKGADINSKVVDGFTPLHNAAKNGDEKIVNILLKHGANVNACARNYNTTPLYYAARAGHEEVLKALLKNNASANIADIEGTTPLHLAALGGYLKIVTALFKHGVDINAKDKRNDTVLHYSAGNGHKAVSEFLIKNGAAVNARNCGGFTPLHLAVLKGHGDLAELLIRSKAEVGVQDIKGITPLHLAALNGNEGIIDLLIKNKAEINARSYEGFTPLYLAAQKGHNGCIISLLRCKADVNAKTNHGFTPLHAAVMGGHKSVVNLLIENRANINVGDNPPLHVAIEAGQTEIIEVLIANGANVNLQNKNVTPLISAIKCNNKEAVEILIKKGADVNAEDGMPLQVAVFAGCRDIVEILLEKKANVNIKNPEQQTTPLHLAAKIGDAKIVHDLLMKGASVDVTDTNYSTPLFYASEEGHEEVINILIANGANVDAQAADGVTSLHTAARYGHSNVVKVLLDNKANACMKDNLNRTALELAVSYGHLSVVKLLLHDKKIDRNSKGNDDYTILHIASEYNNLEMVNYLVSEGCDIHARNAFQSKPVHIAAREGHRDIIEFFLRKGSSINDLGTSNQTLLYYAAMKGHLNVVEYLITHDADINVKDDNGLTPLHFAAYFGHQNVTEALLENGAVYNIVDNCNNKPSEVTKKKSIIHLLSTTEKLFEAVKRNSYSDVKNCLKMGASVNAKSIVSGAPLHYAAWKGYEDIVSILLQYKANPNTVCNKGLTPLHYAAKFSHVKIVKVLLSNGAVFNAVSDSGKTPLDFAVEKNISKLLKLLSETFKKIQNGNSKVVDDLNKINDVDTIKAIMRACNRENKTLVVAAIHSNFPKVEQLKQTSQAGISTQIGRALLLFGQDQYQEALNIFRSAFLKRKEILGPDNPGTLDIQTYIAKVLSMQGFYQEALDMSEEIFQKQKRVLGLNDKDTLNTRSFIAFVLHKQGRDVEALAMFQEIHSKQKEIMGQNHSDTLDTYFHMALVLDRLQNYEEALNINRTIFETKKSMLGTNDPATIRAQNNIAMVLGNQGNYDKALEIYKEVLDKKKKIFGLHHSDTLRTLQSIAAMLSNQKKYTEAVKANQELLNIQQNVFGKNHPESLTTQYNMANVFFAQGKNITALKVYRECFDMMMVVFGPFHPFILDISKKIEAINLLFKLEGSDISDILKHLQRDINIAASDGDMRTVHRLLKDGADVNEKDGYGRTPLHFAVNSGHVGVVSILLNNGADVTQITNKGNTPLHTATSKGYTEMVMLLLKHVSCEKINKFIDAKTLSSGTTSLHIAAEKGSLEIVKALLKHGASYNTENKEGKTPLDCSKDKNVIDLLELVEELFGDAKKGTHEIIGKLKAVKPEVFSAIANVRNNDGNTMLQVAILNKHKLISRKMLELLKSPDQNA